MRGRSKIPLFGTAIFEPLLDGPKLLRPRLRSFGVLGQADQSSARTAFRSTSQMLGKRPLIPRFASLLMGDGLTPEFERVGHVSDTELLPKSKPKASWPVCSFLRSLSVARYTSNFGCRGKHAHSRIGLGFQNGRFFRSERLLGSHPFRWSSCSCRMRSSFCIATRARCTCCSAVNVFHSSSNDELRCFSIHVLTRATALYADRSQRGISDPT